MAASESKQSEQAPLSPKRVKTQLSRYPGPQSQIQASVVQHTDDFSWVWVLIHAAHNAQALPNAKILAKTSKNIFILLFV